ncbi:hypothetical protein QFC22_004989 [Naganishia vaughanmartiniae]|uniref:Uncharacterized protein n=1 Tax=Naganishia vaughanmartiniae TaxID=1424756 RepID=A0ACC2WZA3_9TREE|nr:hypothetical protein QFC22_004989 [Naganishia vaughanmartiniae]
MHSSSLPLVLCFGTASALSKFVESLKSDGGTSHQPMDMDNNTFPEKTRDVPMTPFTVPPHPTTQINSLEAQGITRSQEAAVVTQVFSPYITSSDEHPQTNSNTTAVAHQTPSSDPSQSQSQTHIRNASGDSASLPQSNDYQTVPGILPREIPPPLIAAAPSHASPGGQTSGPPLPLSYASPTVGNSSFSVKATTPLHVGIAFGALPSVSSSSGSGTSAASSNPHTTGPHAHNETTTAAGGAGARLDSPNSSKKHMDRTLRFGFGGK